MKTKKLVDFHIYISVPLIKRLLTFTILQRNEFVENYENIFYAVMEKSLFNFMTHPFFIKIVSYCFSPENEPLTKQKNIIMQKADKGNTVVILDKESYIEKMKELLSDTSKFECLEIPPDKYMDFVINSRDKIKNILKSLHDKEGFTDIKEKLYKKVLPVGCRPGILYG